MHWVLAPVNQLLDFKNIQIPKPYLRPTDSLFLDSDSLCYDAQLVENINFGIR